MTDKSAFTDDEWKAVGEAPLWVTVALFAAGEHGPISMVKEATASARTIAHPPAGGPADELIAEIAKEAEGKAARHNAHQHQVANLEQVIEASLADLGGAATALRKLPNDEAAQVAGWCGTSARGGSAAAKTVTPAEQETIDKIATLFAIPSA